MAESQPGFAKAKGQQHDEVVLQEVPEARPDTRFVKCGQVEWHQKGFFGTAEPASTQG